MPAISPGLPIGTIAASLSSPRLIGTMVTTSPVPAVTWSFVALVPENFAV